MLQAPLVTPCLAVQAQPFRADALFIVTDNVLHMDYSEKLVLIFMQFVCIIEPLILIQLPSFLRTSVKRTIDLKVHISPGSHYLPIW